MGYPPPCQPPLVAAGSSSPSSTPRSIFQIVDALLPRRLLPSGRVSVHLPPKWLAPRVVSIRASRRSPSSLPVAVSCIPTEVFLFDPACRPFSEASSRFGFDVEVRFHLLPKKQVARLPSVASVFSSASRRSLSWLGFAVPLFVTEVVPKNCYCHSYRRCTVVGTSATRLQPSLYHTSRGLCG